MLTKIIFIVGSGRCGTSWIQDWLLRHPQICGEFNESRIFEVLGGIFKYPQKISFNKQMHKVNGIYHWLSHEEFADAMSDFVFTIFDKYCRNHDKNCVLEKTPRHFWWSESINRLLRHRCEVYFVHLYRDGRNVIESFSRQNWSPEPTTATKHWIAEMEYMLAGDCPDNMLHCKYEDLIHDTETLSQTILTFCGLQKHEPLQKYAKSFFKDTVMEFDPHRWKNLEGYGLLKNCFNEMEPTLKKLGY